MGSRRSYALSVVVGKSTDINAGKRDLKKAIKDSDSSKLVASSADLVAKSHRTVDFFYYGLKLLAAVNRLAPSAKDLTTKELDAKIRVAWSTVKREQSIPDDSALDKIVIDAAKQSLGGGRR